MDLSISSTSLNHDDLEDKMKGTYKLPRDLEENETYGIVNTEPGQFEVCTQWTQYIVYKGGGSYPVFCGDFLDIWASFP